MAKENSIVLIGKIIDRPTLSYSKEKDLLQIAFVMEVHRINQRIEFPTVNIFGLTKEQAYTLKSNLEKNKDSYIMVRGMISTRYKEVSIKCPTCGKISRVSYLSTEISTIISPLILHGNYREEEILEYSDRASILGIVCSVPYKKYSTNGTPIVQYQIAVDRRLRIKEQADTKYDYPWIKSYDIFAERSFKHLKVGSQIYMNGNIQTRKATRKATCPNCDTEFTYDVEIAEIVMTSIEYLSNCVFEHPYSESCHDNISKSQNKIINFIKNKLMKRRDQDEKILS